MKVFVGYDTREDIAYQVCKHSLESRNDTVEVIPLIQSKLRDQGWYTRPIDKLASTEFTFTRFMVPALAEMKGWALFIDCDFVALDDVKKLFDQAILQFRYALQIWKNEDLEGISSLYNTIGFTYAETEQYELAIYYYKEALKSDDDYTVALNNLGYAYEKQRMISEALSAYRQVIEREPENETAASRIQILKRRIPKSG